MRVALFVVLISVACATPIGAQAGAWEFGLGTHVAVREDSTVHNGGGLTLARQYRRVAPVLEASGTRRHGHNDWRVAGGPRFTLGGSERSDFFVQVLAGALIRSAEAGWAVLPGAGLDVGVTDSSAVRLQFDVPVERSEARTAKSARASIWLVFR